MEIRNGLEQWLPREITFIVLDYVPLQDLVVNWKMDLYLPNSFLSEKLKTDYQDYLYDSNQVTSKNWTSTFRHLYDFDCKKAKMQGIQRKDFLLNWSGQPINLSCLIEKYPMVEHFTDGDVLFYQDAIWQLFIIVDRMDDGWCRFCKTDGWGNVWLDWLGDHVITHMPLTYWSQLHLFCKWKMHVPNSTQRYILNAETIACVLVHENVSYAIILEANLTRDSRYDVVYPCRDVLYVGNVFWCKFLHRYHLNNDRILMSLSLFKQLKTSSAFLIATC